MTPRLPANPRVLLVAPAADFSTRDVYAGWLEGLAAAGAKVVTFETGRRAQAVDRLLTDDLTDQDLARIVAGQLHAACYEFAPHVVLAIQPDLLPPETHTLIRARGSLLAAHFTESPYEDDRLIPQAAWVDLPLVNDPANLARWQAVNPAATYQPHGFRPSLHRPGPAEPSRGLLFVGTGFPSRIDLFTRLHAADPDLDLALGGAWLDLPDDHPLRPALLQDVGEWTPNDRTAELYRDARLGINLYRREHRPGAHADGIAPSPREIEMAACGLPFLRDTGRPLGDDLLPIHPRFDGPDDAASTARRLLDDDRERRRIAAAGLAAVAPLAYPKMSAAFLRRLDSITRSA